MSDIELGDEKLSGQYSLPVADIQSSFDMKFSIKDILINMISILLGLTIFILAGFVIAKTKQNGVWAFYVVSLLLFIIHIGYKIKKVPQYKAIGLATALSSMLFLGLPTFLVIAISKEENPEIKKLRDSALKSPMAITTYSLMGAFVLYNIFSLWM